MNVVTCRMVCSSWAYLCSSEEAKDPEDAHRSLNSIFCQIHPKYKSLQPRCNVGPPWCWLARYVLLLITLLVSVCGGGSRRSPKPHIIFNTTVCLFLFVISLMNYSLGFGSVVYGGHSAWCRCLQQLERFITTQIQTSTTGCPSSLPHLLPHFPTLPSLFSFPFYRIPSLYRQHFTARSHLHLLLHSCFFILSV